MEFANRSGKITVEIDNEFRARGYIDGKFIIESLIFHKVTPRALVKGGWKVVPTGEYICKKGKYGGYKKEKIIILNNPYKDFLKKHGTTASHFCRIFNAAVYKSAIAPYSEFRALFTGKKGSVNLHRFKQVVMYHDNLVQALKDNQKNILPFIADGYTPQQAKKEFGKSVWKKICANSLSRNKLLVNYRPHGLENYVDYDSTALSQHRGYGPDAIYWIKHICKIPYSTFTKELRYNRNRGEKYDEIKDLLQIYVDTKRMGLDIRQPFNPKWSKLKMKEKHDEYSRIQSQMIEQRRREMDEAYRREMEKLDSIDLSKIYPQTVFGMNGVVATILTKYSQVVDEGSKMHHCVAGYARNVVYGQYLVVHMSGDDEESTLGLDIFYDTINSVRWNSSLQELEYGNPQKCATAHFSQHYGKYNSKVKSENHKAMVNCVVEYFNSLKLTKESYEGI